MAGSVVRGMKMSDGEVKGMMSRHSLAGGMCAIPENEMVKVNESGVDFEVEGYRILAEK